MAYLIPGYNTAPVGPLEQAVIDLMSIEHGQYNVFLFETLRDAPVHQTLTPPVDRAPLLFGEEHERVKQIDNIQAVGHALEDPRIRNCARRLTALSHVRDEIDMLFSQQLETLLGDAGTPEQREHFHDAMQRLLQVKLHSELFPAARKMGELNHFDGPSLAPLAKPSRSELKARHEQERALLKELQDIKGDGLGPQAAGQQIVAFEDAFFKTLRKAAGLGTGVGV